MGAGAWRRTEVPGEGPELVAEEVERHRDRDRDRLRAELAERGVGDERLERDQVDQQGGDADREEAHRLEAGVSLAGGEGPVAVEQEVVGDGDAEGADRGGDVMDAEAADEHREDGEVDQVAGAADEAEFDQLQPARRAAGGGADSVWQGCVGTHRSA